VKLRDASESWSTPRVKGQEGYKSRAQRKGHDIAMSYLESQVEYVTENWPTPTKRDWKGSGPSVERKDGKSRMSHLDYKAELSHFGQTTDPDSLSSPHHQMTTSHGSGSQNTDQIYSLPLQKRLNSKFVEYLMGLPEDWTSLKPIEYKG
jgi:hypothetical protein